MIADIAFVNQHISNDRVHVFVFVQFKVVVQLSVAVQLGVLGV